MSATKILGEPQKYDPSARIVRCALPKCGKEIAVGRSYSFVTTFYTTGPDAIVPAFQCDEQHFCCSAQHAVLVARACIDEHLLPHHAAETARLLAQPTGKQEV